MGLANHNPITLANVRYKLRATFLITISTIDYVETHKIFSPDQEGFEAKRRCSRAITHLGLCI